MHCVSCGRPLLNKPAVAIPSKGGTMFMGPKCAARAGLLPGKARRPANPKAQARPMVVGQIDWVAELEQQQAALL